MKTYKKILVAALLGVVSVSANAKMTIQTPTT